MNAIYFAASISDKNGVNGGSHIDEALAIQEFMIMPTGASTFAGAFQIGSEGGVAPETGSPKEALDVASSEFYKDGNYDLDLRNPNPNAFKWSIGEQLASLCEELISESSNVSIENSFGENDCDAGAHFHSKISDRIQIVGGDLTASKTWLVLNYEASQGESIKCDSQPRVLVNDTHGFALFL
ncbi:hypothetical protein OXX69_001818 [Metschnikowia pulcherrima]